MVQSRSYSLLKHLFPSNLSNLNSLIVILQRSLTKLPLCKKNFFCFLNKFKWTQIGLWPPLISGHAVTYPKDRASGKKTGLCWFQFVHLSSWATVLYGALYRDEMIHNWIYLVVAIHCILAHPSIWADANRVHS